ncbi:glycosyltransferase [Pectobacterium versatile]|uniref:glycosyltransferase n=1 Tax=Pectobacterium versatile TaxID=2488639 RepID=UPI0038695564
MKILYFNTFYYPYGNGGAERSLQVMVEELALNGCQCTIVCCSDNDEYRRINNVDIYYVNVNPFFNSSSKLKKILFHAIDYFNVYAFIKMIFLVKRINPQIINYNNIFGFSPSILLLKKIFRVKTVITLRDYYHMCCKSSLFHRGCDNKQGVVCKCFTLLRRFLLNSNIDTVVANSNKTMSIFLESGYFKNKEIEKIVIYNGFDMDNIKREKPFNWNQTLNIGFFGKVCTEKGFDVFMEATKDLDANMYIAGKWASQSFDFNNLEENYHYLNYTTPNYFFNKIDILIVPSLWHDPLPRTVFEAMSYGVPVVASNMGGIPEAITSGGGWLFNPKLTNELKNILINITNHVYDLKSISSLSVVESNRFNKRNTFLNYYSLYKKLLGVR